MEIKHNCTKEGDFDFVVIEGNYPNGEVIEKDIIKCNICKRKWEEIK